MTREQVDFIVTDLPDFSLCIHDTTRNMLLSIPLLFIHLPEEQVLTFTDFQEKQGERIESASQRILIMPDLIS